MNLLFISQRIPFPPNKGEKIRTFHQIRYLLEHGHTITVCSPVENEGDLASIEAFKAQYNISVVSNPLPFKLLRLALGFVKARPLSIANFHHKTLQQKLNELLNEKSFDAIVCTSSGMAEYVFISSELTGPSSSNKYRPMLLMDFMDLDSDKWLQYSRSAAWPMRWVYAREARLLGQYEKRIQETFDHCFFISQTEVDLFHHRNSKSQNVYVLGNGMDTDAFSPALKPPENPDPAFIFTGVMDYKPNIDAVMWFVKHAWPQIILEFPQARFIIAGMNPTPAIQNLSKTQGVEVTGFVDDILPYYHRCDYFVAPLTIARGVQNKVLQAFACGLPVISSTMGAEGIHCVDEEHIMIANSGEDYLKAIVKLENDTELKSSIRANALKLIRDKYSWNGQLKVLGDILPA